MNETVKLLRKNGNVAVNRHVNIQMDFRKFKHGSGECLKTDKTKQLIASKSSKIIYSNYTFYIGGIVFYVKSALQLM